MNQKYEGGNSRDVPGGGFHLRYVLLIIAVLLALLAIFSHSPDDTAVIEGGMDEPLKNWIGPWGAHLSRLLFYYLGVATYPVILFLGLCALRPLLPYPSRRRGFSGAVLAVVTGIVLLFALWPAEFTGLTTKLGIGHPDTPGGALSGGVIGQQFVGPGSDTAAPGLIRGAIGGVGSFIVSFVFLAVGLFFVWRADWAPVLAAIRGGRMAAEEDDKEIKPRPVRRRQPEQEAEGDDTEEEESGDDKPETESVVGTEDIPPKPRRTPPRPPRKTVSDGGEGQPYMLPPVSLLNKGDGAKTMVSKEFIQESKEILQHTLESFNIDGHVVGTISGPRVTRFEISLAPGVKVDKVTSVEKNIAMDLAAESVRTLAPIPGKSAVGIEVPNAKPAAVYLRGLMESDAWRKSSAEIPIILGKDVAGKIIVTDLAKAPHLLIAGATGSGKSVCMNTLIMSLLYRFSPDEAKIIMVDPKVVELEDYKPLPHLTTPVINDPKKVPLALRWAVNEMERRYRILAKSKVRNLAGFNSRKAPTEPVFDDDGNQIPEKMPFLIVIVDELADIMMTEAKADVETSIARIAQKGRAAGIHIVIATQRPSTNIITGVIKANLPTRIAFRVGSLVDSRVILDAKGAEKLLGRGDMLFIPPGASVTERIQGAMVDDEDIRKVVDFVADQADQEFESGVVAPEGGEEEDGMTGSPLINKYLDDDDPIEVARALDIIISDKKVSTSYIQRRLKIGYNRAAEIIDILEERGIVGPPTAGGSKRDILILDEIEGA